MTRASRLGASWVELGVELDEVLPRQAGYNFTSCTIRSQGTFLIKLIVCMVEYHQLLMSLPWHDSC